MANILDYLDWRGDLTLAERGFNEVDNLLMAELCFLDFSGIVPADFSAPVSLPEAMQKYDAARPQETMGVLVPEQIPELGHKMAASRRFSDLTLCAYVSRTDEETQTQFSALTALLPDKTAYIAFRGTDDTIVGWKEDFNLAFLPVVPAQRMAAEYLAAAAAARQGADHPARTCAHHRPGKGKIMGGGCLMASMNGLSKLGLPKFSDHMDPEDARALRSYLYQMQEQLQYVLTNLDTENMSDTLRSKLQGL